MIHTKVKSSDKYNYASYNKSGVFYNTDEKGFKEIIFVSKNTALCFCIASGNSFADMIEKEFDENYSNKETVSDLKSKVGTTHSKEKIVESDKQETVSETFMLKTLAVVLGKEKIKEIL